MTFASFVCESCRDEQSESCSDACGLEVAELLPPLWEERPACQCCGAELSIVAVLEPVAD